MGLRQLDDRPERRRGSGELNRVLLEIDGRPVGYALYRIKLEFEEATNQSMVQVLEAIGDSPAATAGSCAIPAIDSVADTDCDLLAPDHPLFLLVQRPNRLNWKVFDGLWLRLVDVGAALAARSSAADDRITLDVVADPLLPDNIDTWTLEAGRTASNAPAAGREARRPGTGPCVSGGFTLGPGPRRSCRGGSPWWCCRGRRGLPGRPEAVVPRDLLVRQRASLLGDAAPPQSTRNCGAPQRSSPVGRSADAPLGVPPAARRLASWRWPVWRWIGCARRSRRLFRRPGRQRGGPVGAPRRASW